MKLHELGAQRQTEQIAKVFENRLGDRVGFDRLSPRDTLHMLRKVQRLVNEQRSQLSFHKSERDPSYLKLVMLEQALRSRLGEMDVTPLAIDVNDPKTKQTMQKASKGQPLNPDEQKTMTAIALMKKEGKKTGMKRMVKESELQQAQVVLASQDMLDRVQKMTEDISEMQFKDLPALVDSIKNDMGVEQATAYQAQASAALSTLLSALQQGKTQLDAAQGAITGQAPTVPGMDDTGMDADLDIEADVDGTDGDLDAALDVNADVADEPDQEPKASALGRERR
jgi:urease gamma subunit